MINVINENQVKDFKKLGKLVSIAKGYRTINGFAADCKTNADYISDIINLRIISYPTVKFLDLIANNSEGRVTLKELKMACGYSLYNKNDIEEIKNIYIRRGWFCYANFGEVIDSEYGGYRLVLIIQNDVGNRHSSTTLCCPITSRKKTSMPTHVQVSARECGLQYDSIISTEQTRCISKRRLIQNGIVQKISECPEKIMLSVEVALMKAEGMIDLNINEDEAIEILTNLNKNKVRKYENNYNHSFGFEANRQVAFA